MVAAEIAVTIVVETDAEAAEDTEAVEIVTIEVETDAEAAEDTEAVEIVTIVVETGAEATEETGAVEAVTAEAEIEEKVVMTVDHLVENTKAAMIEGHNAEVHENPVDGAQKRTSVAHVVAEITRGVFI